jgi:hypothetical protein
MSTPPSIEKGTLLRAAAIALIGLALTGALWRSLHVVQVLLPFTFGVAAGVRLGMGMRPRFSPPVTPA